MLLRLWRRWRHRGYRRRPFPDAWREHIERNVEQWHWLDDDEQRRLIDLVRVFIPDKYWEGVRGFEITDEMRVTVAAQACLMLLGLVHHDYFHNVTSIVLHPGGYTMPTRRRGPGGMVIASDNQPLLGEAAQQGPVVLSWQHAKRGGRRGDDGSNLVLHEFAHKLDMKGGRVNGTPVLRDRAQSRRWFEVMTDEYDALQRGEGPAGLLRSYAKTNPAEFFAVATEVFFEKPRAMREQRPELYDIMSQFYGQDPAARVDRLEHHHT